MRHGRAEAFGDEDHRRRLTERGARDVTAAGRWLAEQGLVPTHAYVSSAVRTLDTWENLVAATGADISPVIDDAIYAAGPDSLLDILRVMPEDAEVVLYVGHNPTAASVAQLLDDGEPDREAFRAITAGFPPAALAVLDVHTPWAELGAETARLVGFYSGRG